MSNPTNRQRLINAIHAGCMSRLMTLAPAFTDQADYEKFLSEIAESIIEEGGTIAQRKSTRKQTFPQTTPQKMDLVVNAYRTGQGGLEAVMQEFGVSRSAAAGYIKEARDAGLVPDNRRNKTSPATKGHTK